MRRLTRYRRLGVATALAASAVALAACSSGGPQQAPANANVTLTILTHINAPTQQALNTLDAAFHRKYPNITVQVTAVDSNDVDEVRNTRIEAGNLDITEVLALNGAANPSYVKGQPPNFMGQLITAGKFLNLSGQSFLKDWSPAALQQVGQVNGATYAIPTGRDVVTGVYYNKSIFAKYHLSVPTTWNQFVAVCQKLKANGVTPLIIGGEDGWPAAMPLWGILQSLYPTAQDQANLNKGLWTGTVKYTAPVNVEVLDRLKTIYSYTQPGFAGISYQTTPGRFAAGQAAMMPDGSWSAPTIEQANPSLQFGYFPLPASNNASDNAQWGGKYDVAWSILSSSPHRSAALKWMAFYSDPANYTKFVAANGFISAEPGVGSTPFDNSLHVTDQNFSQVFGEISVTPANAPASMVNGAGFEYGNIAPIGSYTSMTALAEAEQADWDKAVQ
jgi:raffinose/stachyose/melibiose transport system substrate-binding protein